MANRRSQATQLTRSNATRQRPREWTPGQDRADETRALPGPAHILFDIQGHPSRLSAVHQRIIAAGPRKIAGSSQPAYLCTADQEHPPARSRSVAGVLIAASIQASWLPFSLARLWFAGTGRLPLRLLSLLREAHKRGILRQEGGIYQFRHVELQHLLATPDDTSYQAPRQNMLASPAARTHS